MWFDIRLYLYIYIFVISSTQTLSKANQDRTTITYSSIVESLEFDFSQNQQKAYFKTWSNWSVFICITATQPNLNIIFFSNYILSKSISSSACSSRCFFLCVIVVWFTNCAIKRKASQVARMNMRRSVFKSGKSSVDLTACTHTHTYMHKRSLTHMHMNILIWNVNKHKRIPLPCFQTGCHIRSLFDSFLKRSS